MTRASPKDHPFKGPTTCAENSRFQVQTSFDGGTVKIIAIVEIRGAPGVRVDRDHDHLLHEFMEASDG
jgi:hypothetical protein